ncbi:MAG: phage holin family protein [Rhodospirillales bacterium]
MTGPAANDTPPGAGGGDRSGPRGPAGGGPAGGGSAGGGDARGLGARLAALVRDGTTLVRQEIDLAKAEMAEKAGQVGRGGAMLAAGGLVAFAGLLFLLLAGVYGLANTVEPWLAALIVGGVTVVVGGILLMIARSRLSAKGLAPRRTIATLREDQNWAKAQVRR